MRKITIKGISTNIAFDMVALQNFARMEGIEYVNKIQDFFSNMNFENLKFSDLESISNFIYCGIEEGARLNVTDNQITVEDVLNDIVPHPEIMEISMNEFADSLVQSKENESPNMKGLSPKKKIGR